MSQSAIEVYARVRIAKIRTYHGLEQERIREALTTLQELEVLEIKEYASADRSPNKADHRIEYKDVHPIQGEPLRYFVDSRTSRKQHLVDLSEYDGNGRCDCEHFEFKHKKMFEKFGAFPAEHLQCWHIARVLKSIGQDVTYKVMERVDGASEQPERTVRNYVMKP